jgi:hypothetical protein
MRALHSLPVAYNQPTYWYNGEWPCRDPYHDGFNHERYMPDMHDSCVIRLWGREHPGQRFAEVMRDSIFCRCETCSRHYTLISRDDPDHYRDGQVTPLCEACRNLTCPIPRLNHPQE